MRLRTRVEQLTRLAQEKGFKVGACPVCKDLCRTIHPERRVLPDGTEVLIDEPPKRCTGCGQLPFFAIEAYGPLLPDEQLEKTWSNEY